MKKKLLVLLSLSLCSIFAFSACTANQDWPSYDESRLNAAIDKTDDGYFYEESVYRIALDPDYKLDPLLGDGYPKYTDGNGTYISRIMWKEGQPTIVETEISFTHILKANGIESPLTTNLQSTTASFSASEQNFFPISSETTKKINIYFANTATGKNGFKQIDYKSSLDYDYSQKQALGKLHALSESGKYNEPLQVSPSAENSSNLRRTEYEYNNLGSKILFDNNMLYYGLRMLDYESFKNLNKQINVVDIMENTVHALHMTENTKTSKTLPISLYIVDTNNVVTETKHTDIKVRVQGYYLTDGNTSDNNTIKLWYSTLNEVDGGRRYLMKVQEGQLIYTLQKVNGEFIEGDIKD